MAKYMFRVNYTKEGLQGLIKEGGTKRREAATKAIKGVGGKVESFYFSFGEYDAVLIGDIPDNVGAAASSLAVVASGAAECVTMPLLTPAEVDEACKRHVDYRAPGKPEKN